MRSIYCISGLAADHRLFSNLSVAGYKLEPLRWVPYDEADNMETYAAKMAAQIAEANPIVIGLSFGGMLAVEIAKKHADWRVFLVSSAKDPAELGYDSGFLRWVSKMKIIPSALFKTPNPFTLANLGARSAEEKELLTQIIKDSDGEFMRWCVNTLLTWRNHVHPRNVTHIHGTNDSVIRPANVHPDYWVNGGSHIMIYNRGAEVSKIISDCLAG